ANPNTGMTSRRPQPRRIAVASVVPAMRRHPGPRGSVTLPEPTQWLRFGPAFAEKVAAVRPQAVVPIDTPGGPGHFDPVNLLRVPEPEREPRVAGRLIAPAADAPSGLLTRAGVNGHPGADGISAGRGSLQSDREEVSGFHFPRDRAGRFRIGVPRFCRS